MASQCPRKTTQVLRNIQEKEVRMKVKKVTPDAKIPQIQSPGAIGLNLHANEEVVIPTKQREVVPTGIAVEIPRGHYLRIAPRSGMSKKGIDIGAGVIDLTIPGKSKPYSSTTRPLKSKSKNTIVLPKPSWKNQLSQLSKK